MYLPISISPTPEAFTDAEELAKYDFEPSEVLEVAHQLQDKFDYSDLPPLQDVSDDDEEDAGNQPETSLDLLDQVLTNDGPTHFSHDSTHFHADVEKKSAEMPEMPAMEPWESPIECGDPPAPVRRSARQSKAAAAPPQPYVGEKLVAPRRVIKKDSRGYIDAVRGETKQDGEDCLIVHWWDHGEEENTVMTRTHAASLGSDMRALIKDYDSAQVMSDMPNLHHLN